MALVKKVKEIFMKDVFVQERDKSGKVIWKVLILDTESGRILGSCCKMHEIFFADYLTHVEHHYVDKEQLKDLEAVYITVPSVNAIRNIIEDRKKSLYKHAHIYFVESCNDELFGMLAKSPANKKNYIKNLKELEISFRPYGKLAFTLESPSFFNSYYIPELSSLVQFDIEKTAEQILTLCLTLKEYPKIRYYKAKNMQNYSEKVAQLVKKKLDSEKLNGDNKHSNLTSASKHIKEHSQLIILDRGFDCISPLIHDHTFKAMTRDLLGLDNDIYVYDKKNNGEISLESAEFWGDLEHLHIADVAKRVGNEYEKYIKERGMKDLENDEDHRNLKKMIRGLGLYISELKIYAGRMLLAIDCLDHYTSKKLLCECEQNVVMGCDKDGNPISNMLECITPVMVSDDFNHIDKIRLFLLYVLMTSADVKKQQKIASVLNLSQTDLRAAENLAKLGAVYIDENGKFSKRKDVVPRKTREVKYTSSRWIPVMKDIIELAADNKLSVEDFPFVTDPVPTGAIPVTERLGRWKKGEEPMENYVTRLIVLVIGGLSYSEIRCAYEFTESREKKDVEVIIGSTHLTTPTKFVNDLINLPVNRS